MLLGFIDICLSGVLLFIYILISSIQEEKIGSKAASLLMIQGVGSFVLLGFTGLIFVYQGWRLDPVLQFCLLLQALVFVYFGLRDVLIFQSLPQKKSSKD
ncbi:hypothetical protein [Crocosphaera sp.]|uniref:hypothetical protein n=1 Tax=Crocosphaera sp. TaxID=2729996 RepID=UPI003F1F2ED3|nr:hypothetical protein [Crocosphaera sp.]